MSFRLRNNGPIWLGEFTALTEAGFSNGCSCRLHGASSIVPDGFNLALHVGDEAELVNANRRQFAAALGVDAARFTTCAQVHGSKVVCVTEGLIGSGAVDFADTIADTDALITDLQNVPLLLFYADCVPVLLADTETGAVGLAHAGWRGSVEEIALKTVQMMCRHYGCNPEKMLAGVEAIAAQCNHLIIVSNEVFSGGADYAGETDLYLQALAMVNNAVAAKADAVCRVVCGLPVYYKGGERP